MKKITKLLLILVIFANMLSIPVFAKDDIKVIIDGTTQKFDVAPQIINDRTFVPMRAIFEALGARVIWDSESESILAKMGDKSITAVIGNNRLTVDGDIINMDVAPQIVNDRTMVPVRFVSEALNADVRWDDDTKIIHITSTTALKYCYPYTIIPSYGRITGQKYINADVMEGLVIYMYSCNSNSDLEKYMTQLSDLGWNPDTTFYEDKQMATIVFTKADAEVDMTMYFDKNQVLIYFVGDEENIENASEAVSKTDWDSTANEATSTQTISQDNPKKVECWVCYGQKYLTYNCCHGKGTIRSYDVWSHKYKNTVCPQGCNNGKAICPNCSGLGYRMIYN